MVFCDLDNTRMIFVIDLGTFNSDLDEPYQLSLRGQRPPPALFGDRRYRRPTDEGPTILFFFYFFSLILST